MIRLLCHLLGRPYETCKSCDTLREQLKLANEQNKELRETIIDILKPKPIQVNAPSAPIAPARVPWHIKQRELETRSRERAQQSAILKHDNPLLADKIDKLEEELGVNDAVAGEDIRQTV